MILKLRVRKNPLYQVGERHSSPRNPLHPASAQKTLRILHKVFKNTLKIHVQALTVKKKVEHMEQRKLGILDT